MENKRNLNAKHSAIKIGVVTLISLLLLIPLSMIEGVIGEREETKSVVENEVANSYAKAQEINAPVLKSCVMTKPATGSTSMETSEHIIQCTKLDYNVEVITDVLHRSIYNVIVYNSKIVITGKLKVMEPAIKALFNTFNFSVSDFKGIDKLPQLSFGGKTYLLVKDNNTLTAKVELPENAKVGDFIDFSVAIDLKGTDYISFQPIAQETTMTMKSSYPHPSFQGTFLPNHREVSDDGFVAKWSVLDMNVDSTYETMCVKFVDPANPYQQSMRSAKYGMLIIVLVFVAGLFVEFFTRREINVVQYAVIGLSLVLFYSLLVAFSEFISFGWAYIVATLMTIIALMLYFKAILKNNSAYMLGGFVTMVYVVNYMLLQMETFALLAGSLVLFILLCVVMYLTSNKKIYRN
ncbi:MAG: cell envelope integrity protein CreD [Bacteroidales bacterium]|nr:cell envelope integrity protein CreD [Bacteroidales bacterium]